VQILWDEAVWIPKLPSRPATELRTRAREEISRPALKIRSTVLKSCRNFSQLNRSGTGK
jgi:hypothetical protein